MLNLTLERIERQIRNLPVEHVYVLGPDNEILFHHTDNLPDQVRFPFRMLVGHELSIVTHNHPGGKSFSRTDVQMALRAELRLLRVVTRRDRYWLQPPPLGWRSVDAVELDAVIRREALLLEAVIDREIRTQALTTAMALVVTPHRLWERVAASGLIRYGAETW